MVSWVRSSLLVRFQAVVAAIEQAAYHVRHFQLPSEKAHDSLQAASQSPMFGPSLFLAVSHPPILAE
jgi:hypothetical protein